MRATKLVSSSMIFFATVGLIFADPSIKLADNQWVKVCEEQYGARLRPLFVYVPSLNQFVMSGGVNNSGGKNRSFDTEFFDLETGTWVNGYPAGAPYKNIYGPTDAPGSGHDGWPKKPFQIMSNGVTRIRMDNEPAAYSTDTQLHDQYAWHADEERIYVFFFGATATYNPKVRKWDILPATNFTGRGMHSIYGSLAYDPINREIISLGGTSEHDGGSPGCWRLASATGQWERQNFGNPDTMAFSTTAQQLSIQSQAYVNRWRNRFYLTESDDEAKENLALQGEAVVQLANKLAKEISAAKPAPEFQEAWPQGVAYLKKFATDLATVGAKLNQKLDGQALIELQGVADIANDAARALDTFPCGRAHSQMATDPDTGKIVLFGGSRIDSFLADTWVYDCKSRVWEQRFPTTVPSPRAGHTLAWLPGARKIVLSGGYNEQGNVGADVWLYDVSSNEWQQIMPAAGTPKYGGVAAVGANDTLVMVGADTAKQQKRVTWACRIVPAASHMAAGNPPATVAKQNIKPEAYDSITTPNPAAVADLIKAAPFNQWTMMPKPPKGTAKRDWGTLPYDTDRHQILHWGGGHSSYVGTDLAHYSMRTATWSLGYTAENYPSRGFFVMSNRTFNNRPNVPNHVWDAAAYDPISKRGIWVVRGHTWSYDPTTRAWDSHPAPKIHPQCGELQVALATTPKGVVAWFNGALYLFDAKGGKWNQLPIEGGKIGDAFGDTSGICYDSKRDSLWLAHRLKPMMQYEMASGKLTIHNALTVKPVFMRETVYIPEMDMLINMIRVQSSDDKIGNYAYDIANDKWIGLELPFGDGNSYLPKSYFSTSGSRSIHYDPVMKIAIFLYEADAIWFLKIDKSKLNTFPVEPAKPGDK